MCPLPIEMPSLVAPVLQLEHARGLTVFIWCFKPRKLLASRSSVQCVETAHSLDASVRRRAAALSPVG